MQRSKLGFLTWASESTTRPMSPAGAALGSGERVARPRPCPGPAPGLEPGPGPGPPTFRLLCGGPATGSLRLRADVTPSPGRPC